MPAITNSRPALPKPALAPAPGKPPAFTLPSQIVIDPTNPAKKAETTLGAAVMSKLAYETDPAKVRTELTRMGFKDIRLYGFGTPGSTQAIVARRGDVVTVAFRGTQEVRDFGVDALATNMRPADDLTGREVQDFKRFEGAKLHRGFSEALETLWSPRNNTPGGDRLAAAKQKPLLLELQKEADKPGTKFVFTGHSLGGALATLAAAELSVQNPASSSRRTMAENIGAVITFGSPKVGNAAFVKAYDQSLGAVTQPVHHAADGVRGIPPDLLGYRHVGAANTLFIPPKDAAHPPNPLDSHDLNFYMERLSALVPRTNAVPVSAPANTSTSGRGWVPR